MTTLAEPEDADSGSNPRFGPMQRYAEVVRDAVHQRLVPPDAPTFADGLACAVAMDRAAQRSRV